MVFIVFTKSLLEKKDEMTEDIVEILKEFKDMFSVKSPLDLSPKRKRENYAISIILE
jgi:hypothetical protein